MEKDQYLQAVKTIQAKKARDNFMVIRLDWETKMVLPHKDGVAIMAALNNAECLTGYGDSETISPLKRDKFEATLMSVEEYQQYKIAALLKVPVKEIREYEEKQPL